MLHSISQQLTSLSCSETENLELVIESNLLKANLYLQQGHAALRYGSPMHVFFRAYFLYFLTILPNLTSSLSSETAVSSLVLLQTSPVILRGSTPGFQEPVSELPNAWTGIEQVACLYK